MSNRKRWRFSPEPLRRCRRGATTTAIGARLKRPMSGRQIADIEEAKRYPRADTLVRLCNDLALDPRDFFVRGAHR